MSNVTGHNFQGQCHVIDDPIIGTFWRKDLLFLVSKNELHTNINIFNISILIFFKTSLAAVYFIK